MRMRVIAAFRARYGFGRIPILMRRRAGKTITSNYTASTEKKTSIYAIKALVENRSATQRLDRPTLTQTHQLWSMDFVHDQLFAGRIFRILTVIDV